MILESILNDKKDAIVKKWLELIAGMHPAGSGFFNNKDRFTNPVGYTITTEITTIFDELSHGRTDSERISGALERIIKIRAVQDLSPSEAVGFIFQLKTAVNDELHSYVKDKNLYDEAMQISSGIDSVGLLAFDIHTRCREKINEIRVNEIKADRENAFRLLERMRSKVDEVEDGVAGRYNGSEVTA